LCAALANGDVDRALALGLLKAMPCPACSVECQVALVQARIERKHALAARERYRARNARLQRRRDERATRRGVTTSRPEDPMAGQPTNPSAPDPTDRTPRPVLPAAVAAALARAKAKAAMTPPPAGPKS
jgi:Na+-translocating ferredoxin:NAD+ oxidoreductase RnfC subunit